MPETFVEEPLCAVFQKVSKSEKVYGSEAVRRVSSFSVGIFLSYSAERFRRRGEYQGFPSKIFCITAEKFHREIL